MLLYVFFAHSMCASSILSSVEEGFALRGISLIIVYTTHSTLLGLSKYNESLRTTNMLSTIDMNDSSRHHITIRARQEYVS